MSFITLENIAWLASFLNILAMALQFGKLIQKRNATGVSIGMLAIFCFVQGTYMMVGYRSHQWALFWGMVFSLLLTAASACLSFYLQRIKPAKKEEAHSATPLRYEIDNIMFLLHFYKDGAFLGQTLAYPALSNVEKQTLRGCMELLNGHTLGSLQPGSVSLRTDICQSMPEGAEVRVAQVLIPARYSK